jgi:hypothetical protein
MLHRHPLARLLRVRGTENRWDYRVWQHGTGPIESVCDAAAAARSRDACHAAPVAAGLVKRPEDWPWSSVHRSSDGGPNALALVVRDWPPLFRLADPQSHPRMMKGRSGLRTLRTPPETGHVLKQRGARTQ